MHTRLSGFVVPVTLLLLLSARPSMSTNTTGGPSKPLNKVQVLGLVRGGVADRRLLTLVRERGIDFTPSPDYLSELRRAGGDDRLVKSLRSLAPQSPAGSTEPKAQMASETASGESAFITAAGTFSKEGKWAQAVSEYRLALQQDPDNPSTLNDLGVALAKTGDLNGAIDSYRRAAALAPGLAAVQDNLAVALEKKGDFRTALREFRSAVEAEPGDLQAHQNLGLALENQGDLGGAVREYRAALQIDPGSYEAEYNLARALEKAGQLDQAIAAFRRAVAQKPNNAMAHYGLGIALEGEGDLRAALEQYRQARQLAPVDPLITLAYAKLERSSAADRVGSNR
jgi:Flp pilus assembly protein TadD